MREYFTVVVKENSNENLGLLTEKLNEGFFINDRIPVGKSVLMILQKRQQLEMSDTQPMLGIESANIRY